MADKVCTIGDLKTPVGASIRKLVGLNNKNYQTIINLAFTEDKYSNGFLEYCAVKDITLTSNPDDIAKQAIRYYNFVRPSVYSQTQTRLDDVLSLYGYTTLDSRENGKSFSRMVMLNTLSTLVTNNSTPKGDPRAFYLGAILRDLTNSIDLLIPAAKRAEIKEEYQKIMSIKSSQDRKLARVAFWEKYIPEGIKNTTVYKDRLALFRELTGSKPLNYLDELLYSSKLLPIKKQIDKYQGKDTSNNQDEAEAAKHADGNSDLNENIHKEDDIVDMYSEGDTMISVANNHIGAYTNFMAHIGERAKLYFDCLPKLNSVNTKTVTTKVNGKDVTRILYDVAKDDILDLPTTMDATTCSSALYGISYQFTSVPAMIDAIRQYARDNKEYAAFEKFANDLANDYDFAFEIFSVFAKTVIKKMQVVYNDGRVTVFNSNSRASRKSAFFFNTRTALQNAILISEGEAIKTQIADITETLNSIENNLSTLNDVYASKEDKQKAKEKIDKLRNIARKQLVDATRLYYSNIEEGAILAYLDCHNNAGGTIKGFLNNAIDLQKWLSDTNIEHDKSKLDWQRTRQEIEDVNTTNAAVEDRASNGDFADFSEKRSLSEIKQDWLTGKQSSTLNTISEVFLKYSTVSLSLNSPNALGNNSSDVINNSYLTNLVKMMENIETVTVNGVKRRYSKTLETWGKNKLRTESLKYNSLLLTQRDKDGVKQSEGIFDMIDDKLYLSDNAEYLLQASLFDGSSYTDAGNNMTYDKMKQGDFLPTAYLAYHKTKQDRNFIPETSKGLATYFLRTPSDAPKTFTITSAKYDVRELFKDADETEKDAIAEQAVADLVEDAKAYVNDEFVKEYGAAVPPIPYEDYEKFVQTAIPCITGKRGIKLLSKTIKGLLTKLPNGDKVMAFALKPPVRNSEGVVIIPSPKIIVKGYTKKIGGLEEFHATKILGISSIGNPEPVPEVLKSYVRENVRNEVTKHDYWINGHKYNMTKKTINTSSKLFAIVKNHFKKELLDAATALDHYFELDDKGFVTVNDDDDVTISTKTEALNSEGYLGYHLNSNGKVIEKDENGDYYLGGKVFHSTKFTLSITETDENGYETVNEKNYLDHLITTKRGDTDPGHINLLYGGAGSNYLRVKRKDNKPDGKIVDVELTREQNAAVDKALSDYLLDLVEQSDKRINAYKEFINDVAVNWNNNADYTINNLIMLLNYDDLLEGNTKHYKDSQTFLKRAKEYQGSGIPYAAIDYSRPELDYSTNVVENCLLNNGSYNGEKIQEMFKRYLGHEVLLRYSFNAVTVKNSTQTNKDRLDALVIQLKKAAMNEGYSEADAEEKAITQLYGPVVMKDGKPDEDEETKLPKRKGGFTETKVNDAQSYITLEEWIRRVAARGQLYRYLPLISKLIDPNYKITTADLTEFVQVQKNFYYDIYYNEKYGIEVPRQIKNAEFVLIPKLIEGTQLEEVYNLMQEAGIDQLNTKETSKASNVDVLTLWNDAGELTGRDTFVEQASNVKQLYSYKYLYTQQETPQHMDAQNKVGSQVVKKVLDNIKKDSPLYKHKVAFLANMVQNIRDSYNNLMEEFEVPRNPDGSIKTDVNGNIDGLNIKVFYEKLRDEMTRLGVDSNLIDYVTIENGEPRMPALFNVVLSRFESVVQSMFNQAITRQKLPGFHAAQITNIGWSKLNDTVQSRSYHKDLAYHPDQYRKIGTDHVISKRIYDKLSDETKKKYENIGPAPYIEVMLPASAFGIDRNSSHYSKMTDEQILEELEAKGLDTVIGYRIPTEGKQSVCIMKCVGFTDDTYGSTIVVPNDWVSQTGSDFDIDSVYGIQYSTYKTSTGEIKKIDYIEEYNTGDEDKAIIDWFNYIKHYGDRKLSKYTTNTIKEKLNKVKAALESTKNIVEESDKAFNELDDFSKNTIKRANFLLARKQQTGNATEETKRLEKYNVLQNTVDKLIAEYSSQNKDTSKLEDYKQIVNFLHTFYSVDGYHASKSSVLASAIKKNIKQINEAIKGTGLVTLDEFKEKAKTVEGQAEINSRKARNNKILSSMLEILASPLSLEENLSRSNFDDIIYWRDQIMNQNQTKARKNRSVYNILDQIAYQEDATSGLALKGMSVAMDTLCSVCNTAEAYCTSPITVIYDKADFKEDTDRILGRFNTKDNQNDARLSGNSIVVTHRMYGHSNDNKNIAGRLITAYSSETTAHILDAIKEGAIPGVNEYTFTTYKSIVNMGSDYKTAISFIMQPGVQRIINNNNKNNSVFAKSYGNPIHNTIRDIAKELGCDVTTYTPIKDVIVQLKKFEPEFNELFHYEGDPLTISLNDKGQARIPLIVSKMVERIKEIGEFSPTSPVGNEILNSEDEELIKEETAKYEAALAEDNKKKLLFDLGIVLIFDHLKDTADKISSIATCLNPDKFGAKQTVFATTDTFDKMLRSIYNYENVEKYTGLPKEKDNAILVVKNKAGEDTHILKAVYPGIEEGTPAFPQKGIVRADRSSESVYPTLYAYLKYATATSTVVAKKVFPTQDPVFVDAVRGFTRAMSGISPKITEEIYTDVEKYMLSYFYNTMPQICHPLVYDYKTNKIVEINDGSFNVDEENEQIRKEAEKRNREASMADEIQRVYGFGYSPTIAIRSLKTIKDATGKEKEVAEFTPFDVYDVNEPTEEEVNAYMKLTPAQKVEFIQQKFTDQGIFGYLDVSLYNDFSRGYKEGTQTIEYKEGNISNEVLYNEFVKVFNSKNPLIKLAAIDLIKYAVLVEGFRMTNRGIAKIISNEPLINPLGDFGIGFVTRLKGALNKKNADNVLMRKEVMDDIYENYLRSHPDTKAIKTLYKTSKNVSNYNLTTLSHDIIKTEPSNPKVKQVTLEDGTTVNSFEETDDEKEQRLAEWKTKLTKAGILEHNKYDDTYKVNKYVFVDVKGKKQLYKIVKLSDVEIVMYPLGRLEKNEVTDFSIKLKNQQDLLTKETYERLIQGYRKVVGEGKPFNSEAIAKYKAYVEFIKVNGQPAWETYADRMNIIEQSGVPAKAFDLKELAETNNDAALALATIKKHLTAWPDRKVYLNSNILTQYIYTKSDDFAYGSPQVIKLDNGKEVTVMITRFDDTNYKDYLKIDVRTGKYKKQDLSKLGNIAPIIEKARSYAAKYINNGFVVTPFDDSTMHATIEEVNADMMDYMVSQRSQGNETAANSLTELKNNNINATNVKFNASTAIVMREAAKVAKDKARECYNDVNTFIEDPDQKDHYLHILDPKVQELMKGNKKLEEKYVRVCNEINAALTILQPYYELNMVSEDPEINHFLADIKTSFEDISRLPLEQINKNYMEGLIAQRSTNPLIRTNMIKAYDAFYGSSGLAWMFNDIGEATNPLVQIMLNEIQSNIEASRNMTKLRVKQYDKKIEEIQKKARERGETIDMNKVIQEYNGEYYLAQDWSPEFEKDFNELRDKVDTAGEVNGYGSYEHLKAKNDLDKFILTYCNQEAQREYYYTKVGAESAMLERHPEIYVKYMQLFYKLLDLRNYQSAVGVNEEIKQQIKDVVKQIRDLHSKGYWNADGVWTIKPYHEPGNLASLQGDDKIYTQNEAMALAAFLSDMRELNERFFEYNSAYGFEEQLAKNLEIVKSFEKRDPNTGVSTVPQNVLEQNEQYRIAKNWIRNNAIFILMENEEANNDPNSISKRLLLARKRLSIGSNGRHPNINKRLKDLGAHDDNGVIDGRKISDEEIARIKEEQEHYYQGGDIKRGGSRTTDATNSSRQLLNSAIGTDDIYKQEFWNQINGPIGQTSAKYLQVVQKLNKLLEPIYDKSQRVIRFDLIPDTEEGREKLWEIAKGFAELRKTTKRVGVVMDDDQKEQRKEFLKNEVKFVENREAFRAQGEAIKNRSDAYKEAWRYCNYECTPDGKFVFNWTTDENGKKHMGYPKLNSYVYCHLEAVNKEKWLDKEKTEDIKLIQTYYRKVPTAYYYKALSEAIAKDVENPGYYKEWYNKNHVFNPYTNTVEPLECWVKSELRDELFENNEQEGKWVPIGTQRKKAVKNGEIKMIAEDGSIETFTDPNENMVNPDYKEGVGLIANYRKGAKNGKYDNPVTLNDSEKELRDYLQKTLIAAAGDNVRAKRYYETGKLPRQAINSKTAKELALSEAGKLIGISSEINHEAKDWEVNVGYEHAFARTVPMTSLLMSEKLGSTKFTLPKPMRREGQTKEEYEKEYIEWKNKKKEVEKKNAEIDQQIRDKDWLNVIHNFLNSAYVDLAIEENKQKVYWMHNILRKQKVYTVDHNLMGDASIQTNDRKSINGHTEYVTQIDEKLLQQWETFMRRFILDQWKEKSGKRTKVGNHLQNFTSANYMMLNFRGGIANVTLGETAMWAEAFAGEYFGKADLLFGHIEWHKGLMGFARGCYDEDNAYGLQDGLTKLFKVVDYDEQRGISTEVKISKYAERLRNAMFSPQTIGEHQMQNSVLFAMLRSHKIIDFPEDTRGIGKIFMNESEYIRYREANTLYEMLPEEKRKKFDEFKAQVKGDTQELAKYAWFRKDIITEFVLQHLDENELDQFDKTRKENREKFKKEFAEKDNMWSQFEYSDGELKFKPNSELDLMNQIIDEDADLSEKDKKELEWQCCNKATKAYTLCGLFSNRVREVNTKIHGAYHRFGRAWIENKWYGSIIMQYHKHLPIGILKRYRTRGYYNEARGSVEKGFLTAFRDFMSLNARRVKWLREDQKEAIEGVQNICAMCMDYVFQIKTTWHHMPDYDKQTIRRNIGDAIGVLAGILVVLGLKLWGDDDDELEDNLLFNLALYEGDRLASEAFLYNPIGLLTETKTLMKTPVAAESVVEDVVSAVGLIGQFIMQGDDFSMTYKSGIHSGENKLLVFLERRIPMWHGIRGVIDIKDNNRAYKLGTKPTSVASTILKWIKE